MSLLLRVCSDYWGMVGLVLTVLGGVFVFTESWPLALVLLAGEQIKVYISQQQHPEQYAL